MVAVISHGVRLAVEAMAGSDPAVLFLPGFASDMRGTKAEFLADWCASRGGGFTRFDYSGHGESGGAFEQGTIGRWTDDARAVLHAMPAARVVLVGSSMGGWIALNLALAAPARIAGLVLLAPAPDFTEDLMWDAMMPDERAMLLRAGVLRVPSAYGPPTPITRTLIEEGRQHLLLRAPIGVGVPVRILHGQRDPDVPWQRSLTLAERLTSEDVRLTLIKDADHRLSRPEDLALLGHLLGGLRSGMTGVMGMESPETA